MLQVLAVAISIGSLWCCAAELIPRSLYRGVYTVEFNCAEVSRILEDARGWSRGGGAGLLEKPILVYAVPIRYFLRGEFPRSGGE